MPRHTSNNRRGRGEIYLGSRGDASVEFLVRRGLIEIRKPSDPESPALRFTITEWHALRRDIEAFGRDFIGDEIPAQREAANRNAEIFDGSARIHRRNTGGGKDMDRQHDGTSPPRNFYELLQWLIIYATANGKKHQRLRLFIFMIVLFAICMTTLLVGVWVAVGTGMPRLATCSISAGGTVLFALVAALVSKLRHRKTTNQKSD